MQPDSSRVGVADPPTPRHTRTEAANQGYSVRPDSRRQAEATAPTLLHDPGIVLSVERLAKGYHEIRALDGVDLCLREGEILGLLGPNGAGKTTLVSVAAGLSSPDGGSVTIDVDGVATDPRRARRQIGLAPQIPGLYPTVSVLDNLRYFGRLAGLHRRDLRRRVDEIAELLSLGSLLERFPSTLSGGERRRVSTAIAVLHHPKLLLLDEPTAGIDVESRREVLNMVKTLAGESIAICYLTHRLSEVEALNASVAILEKGRILAHGSLSSLIEAHGDSIIELTFVPGAGPTTVAGNAVDADGQVRVPAPDPEVALQRVLTELAASTQHLRAIEMIRPSLESVYLNLVGRRYGNPE